MAITQLTKRLGIQHPIVLAPMGNVAGGRLAASVSNAGGLGMIGVGYGDLDWLKTELAILKRTTTKPWGVGFITWSLTKEVFDFVMRYSPSVVMMSFGDINQWVDKIKSYNIPLICQVQSLSEALEVNKKGADFIVTQGSEAGGHGKSQRSTLSLTKGVIDHLPNTPVIAAGGIADGKSLAAMLSLGAVGASIGSRFYASTESLADDKLKQKILESSGDDTVRTDVFDIIREISWPKEYSGRALKNAFTSKWHGNGAKLKRQLSQHQSTFFTDQQSVNLDSAIIWAGECIDSINDIQDAESIVNNMITDAEHTLGSAI
ncbi:MAG: 2-nitropropane dioxygenase [Methylophaga sp.]|uniref:NAD(P)H-dependent flavin oxidoreductase n=1 Tax=Methylophaga sp. UBA678 TaxID=1946901 RepID=UPI000C49ECDC|nr:nitronate monooxygenase [Methylophaga sp. UBA678]MAX51204.1 2-nitropropane dioxygenase [Methylophaga sp.]|tara:strand:+ start:13480 stop:14433 length:954 start_codon:yes stop_codon:yes gene_type:complete